MQSNVSPNTAQSAAVPRGIQGRVPGSRATGGDGHLSSPICCPPQRTRETRWVKGLLPTRL